MRGVETMERSKGFTLIELLVVIAIISILAAIVVPNVVTYIARANMTKAVAEIDGIQLALTKMLTDVDKKDFRQFFSKDGLTEYNGLSLADQVYVSTGVAYRLLRMGKQAAEGKASGEITWEWTNEETSETMNVKLDASVISRLGSNNLEDLGKDPWGSLYQFWFGPWHGATYDESGAAVSAVDKNIQFRSWRPGEEDAAGTYTPYTYDDAARAELDKVLPGAPAAPNPGLPGFPAPTKLPVYIFSMGDNMRCDQYFNDGAVVENEYKGGGDDINNWDSEVGWKPFYG